MDPYKITFPETAAVPIVVSVPHCGTIFPDELKDEFDPELISSPDDTDWFVDKLYDFAPSIGITMINAVYSRWVIDLNRDEHSKPLYNDGRIITGLCPTTTFLGEPLYNDKRKEVEVSEAQRRLVLYYKPYHEKVQELLNSLKTKFGVVLLWDCHSIRQVVPTIQKETFTDLILGSADGKSADKKYVDLALRNLGSDKYSLNHNHPFKGGTITRSFGNPSNGQHALQLEMTKVNYMDDREKKYDLERAGKMRELLKKTLGELSEAIMKQ